MAGDCARLVRFRLCRQAEPEHRVGQAHGVEDLDQAAFERVRIGEAGAVEIEPPWRRAGSPPARRRP